MKHASFFHKPLKYYRFEVMIRRQSKGCVRVFAVSGEETLLETFYSVGM